MNTNSGRHAGPWSIEAVAVTAAVLTTAVASEHPVVDAVVVFGLGVIAPLALGRSLRWSVAAVSGAVALFVGPGAVGTVLVVPALVAAIGSVVSAVAGLEVRLANGIGFVLLGLLATRPPARTATGQPMLLEVGA